MAVGIEIEDGDFFLDKPLGDTIYDSDVIDAWDVFMNVDDMIDPRIMRAHGS